MTRKNQASLEARQREKSDCLFLVYQWMGPERSLIKLLEYATSMGLKISENTIKRYSVKFGWQRRLLENQSKESERLEQETSKIVDEMNRQDAMMAQGMKALVIAGLRYHQERMKRSRIENTINMKFSDLAGMARSAQHIERLARGQATSRTEVWVDVASTVVREFVLIFDAVNKLDSPDEREQEFLRLGDEMMTRYYSEAVKGQIDTRKEIYKGGG